MNNIKDVIKAGEMFYNNLVKDPNSRFRSWEYCYKSFQDARKSKNRDIDYLCLQLGFYLANWGMFRNSFLMEKDYKIHKDLVIKLLDKKYDNYDNVEYLRNNIDDLIELINYISDYYKPYNNHKRITDTLTTKILLGTLGCLPAYDNQFKKGIRSVGLVGYFGKNPTNTIKNVLDYYENNKKEFEKLRAKMNNNTKYPPVIEYPPMKVVDCCFWELGK